MNLNVAKLFKIVASSSDCIARVISKKKYLNLENWHKQLKETRYSIACRWVEVTEKYTAANHKIKLAQNQKKITR